MVVVSAYFTFILIYWLFTCNGENLTGPHVCKSEKGVDSYYCCYGYYEDDGKCLECKYKLGKLFGGCGPCPLGTYGHKCEKSCNCNPNERCDSKNGCVPITVQSTQPQRTSMQTSNETTQLMISTKYVYIDKEKGPKGSKSQMLLYVLAVFGIVSCTIFIWTCSRKVYRKVKTTTLPITPQQPQAETGTEQEHNTPTRPQKPALQLQQQNQTVQQSKQQHVKILNENENTTKQEQVFQICHRPLPTPRISSHLYATVDEYVDFGKKMRYRQNSSLFPNNIIEINDSTDLDMMEYSNPYDCLNERRGFRIASPNYDHCNDFVSEVYKETYFSQSENKIDVINPIYEENEVDRQKSQTI